MRCGAWVKWKMSGKKRPRKKAATIISMYNHYVRGMPLTDSPPGKIKPLYKEEDLEPCDGEVEVSIRVGIDGGCACCGATELRIEYKCKKCGNTDFYELPQDEESLSAFLTGFFVGMEEDHRFAWLMEGKERQEKYDAEMRRSLEKLEEDRKKEAEKRKKKKAKKKKKKS